MGIEEWITDSRTCTARNDKGMEGWTTDSRSGTAGDEQEDSQRWPEGDHGSEIILPSGGWLAPAQPDN